MIFSMKFGIPTYYYRQELRVAVVLRARMHIRISRAEINHVGNWRVNEIALQK